MRLLTTLIVGCLALPLCFPHERAFAGEAEEDAPPPGRTDGEVPKEEPPTEGAPTTEAPREQAPTDEASQLRAQRDRIAAGVIGRGLVSPDEAVRRKAVDQLLARLRESGPVEPFLRAMGDAVGNWANQQDRLMEVWLDQAVNGTAAERDRAVLLLTALGAKAVRRLTLELRHGVRHRSPGEGTRRAAAKADGTALDEPSASAAPQRPVELAAGLPRRYDVADLLALGWDHWRLRSMLLREADAVSATKHTDGYIVTALPKGHESLRTHLQVLRTKPSAPAAGAIEAGAKKPAGTESEADRDKNKPRQPVPGQDGGVAAAQPAPPTGARAQPGAARKGPRPARAAPVPFNRAAPDWLISPELLHLPRGGLLAARLSVEGDAIHERDPIGRKSDVVVGSLMDAKRWAREARQMPDARAELPLQGTTALAAGGTARLFAGKVIRYSKDLERTKGGAWRIVSDIVHHGIELKLVVTREDEGLRVRLRALRSDVGLPMRVVTVRPSERAAPVELECPEWDTTSVSRSFKLPLDGGGVFLPLEGLGSGADDHVVLVLGVEPYKPSAPQQAAVQSVR